MNVFFFKAIDFKYYCNDQKVRISDVFEVNKDVRDEAKIINGDSNDESTTHIYKHS